MQDVQRPRWGGERRELVSDDEMKALEAFQMVKDDGFVGVLVYYDGTEIASESFGPFGLNTVLIMTTVKRGAVVANHPEVVEMPKVCMGS